MQKINFNIALIITLIGCCFVSNNAIAQLPAQQREVYQLCHQQGLKYEEVAEKLGLAPSTVATHMKLALKSLRNYLQKHINIYALLVIFKLF